MNKKNNNILTTLKENFILCKKDYPINIKSVHWNIFPKKFEEIFHYKDYWESHLNTIDGDSSVRAWAIKTNFFLKNKKLNIKKKREYQINSYTKNKLIREFHNLKELVGLNYIKNFNDGGTVGSPRFLNYKNIPLTFVDMEAIYYSWVIDSELKNYLKKEPFILEIGAGVGNLSVKLKKLFPKSTIILIDIPEVSSLQRFYQWKHFPKAKVFDYKEYKKNGINNLYKKKYDFVFLPPWIIKNIKNKSIDLAINIRSMMEMDTKIVSNYIFHIERIVKNDCFFYCVNRYRGGDGDRVKIKDYSFSDNWYFIKSNKAWQQPWIHETLLRKTDIPNFYSPKKTLSKLHPLYLKDVYPNLKEIFFIIKNIIITKDHRTYNNSLNVLIKIFFIPIRSRLKIRTRLKFLLIKKK